MPNRKLFGAAAMAGALTVGGVAGAILGNPITSGAQKASTTPTTTVPTGQGGPGGGHKGPRGGFGGPELDAAAKAIGISTADLRTALQSGKSIAEVAKSKGVDRQKVIDAMVAAAKAQLAELEKSLPDRMAAMVDGKRPTGQGGPGGPGMGGKGGMGGPDGDHGGRGRFGLAAAAKALGMTEADLGKELRSGKTLAEVAKAKGVAEQKVIDALVAEAKTRLAAEVKEGHLTQAQADERAKTLPDRIKAMVEGKRPAGGPGGGMGPGGPGMGGPGMGGMGPGMGGPGGGPDGHFGGGPGNTTTTAPAGQGGN